MWETRRTIQWATPNPEKLAYRLREAIYASKFHDEFRDYNDLKFIYQIRVMEGAVAAVYRGVEPSEVIFPKSASLGEDEDGSEIMQSLPQTLTVDYAKTILDVIGTAIEFKDAAEIYFPEALLSPADFENLYAWVDDQGLRWRIIDNEDRGMTLTTRPVDEEITWKPS